MTRQNPRTAQQLDEYDHLAIRRRAWRSSMPVLIVVMNVAMLIGLAVAGAGILWLQLPPATVLVATLCIVPLHQLYIGVDFHRTYRASQTAREVLAPQTLFQFAAWVTGFLVAVGATVGWAVRFGHSVPFFILEVLTAGFWGILLSTSIFRYFDGTIDRHAFRLGRAEVHFIRVTVFGLMLLCEPFPAKTLFWVLAVLFFFSIFIFYDAVLQLRLALRRGELDMLTQALDHWPYAEISATTRVQILHVLGRDSEVCETVRRTARWTVFSFSNQLYLGGQSFLAMKDIRSARVVAQALLATNADQPEGWLLLARCDLASGQVSRHTIRALETARAWHERGLGSPIHTASWVALQSQAFAIIGDTVHAQTCLEQAISLATNPHPFAQAQAWFEIAVAQQRLSQDHSAALQKARHAAPGSRWDVQALRHLV